MQIITPTEFFRTDKAASLIEKTKQKKRWIETSYTTV